jgi:hypothetical protein
MIDEKESESKEEISNSEVEESPSDDLLKEPKEEISDKKEDAGEEGNIPEKQERGAKILLFVIFAGVVLLFIFGWIFSESNKFDYIGLTFVKEKFGDIPIFTTYITGKSIYGTPIDYKMVLREDPRKSVIPVEANLAFVNDKPIYFSLNMSSNIQECGSVPMSAFGLFSSGMRWDLETVASTEDWAEKLEREHVNCDNTLDATVLFLTKGDESKIYQEGDNCYVLSVNNCELEEVLERFQVATLSTMTGRPL